MGTCRAGLIKCSFDVLARSDIEEARLNAQGTHGPLNLAPFERKKWAAHIHERRDPGDAWNHLFQQLDSFAVCVSRLRALSRDIAARPGEACNEAQTERLPACRHDDRDCARCLLGRSE